MLLVAISECCLCRLLTAKTRNVMGLSQQPAFMGCQLSTHVYLVHLVDELVLVFYTTFCLCSFFRVGEGGGLAVEYGFSILGVLVSRCSCLFIYLFIYYFIILLFIYLFLVKGLFTIKYKYYTIFK